jgi:hypothetical protein
VAKRFASDMALLQQQIRPSSLPSTDRALRLWAFFTAYAQAAAGKESTPAGKELFDKTLKENGFGELRDKKTGQDGIKVAKWVLDADSPGEAGERAGDVEMVPPEVLAELLKEGTDKPGEANGKQGAKPGEANGKQGAKQGEGAGKSENAQAGDEALEAEPEHLEEGARKPDSAHPQASARKPEAKGQDAFRKADSAHSQESTRKPDNSQGADDFRKPENTQTRETPRRPDDLHRTDSKSSEIKDSSFKDGPERPTIDRTEARNEQGRLPPQMLEQRPLILPKNPELERRQDDDSMVGSFEDAWKKLRGNLRLGPNMLWNVLHRSRNSPEDSATEKEKWNQLVFAAMLAFVGLMLLIILVVSL